VIRAATAADGPVLQEIEIAAGAQFTTVGLADVAAHEPFTIAELDAYAAAGRSWVAARADGAIEGYAVADVVDGCAHLEQVSVRPEAQGRGLGRALVARVEDWARAEGYPAVTLTTFVDVEWNGPLYAHLGYRVLAEAELGPGLRAVRDAETRLGLDPSRRVCMRHDVGTASAPARPS
jgi:GNAT superfamily N-acetyltransferase